MNNIEYILSNIFLHLFYYIFFFIPINKKKITFASPRNTILEGNIKYIYRALYEKRKDYKYIFLFEKYSYSFLGKIFYLFRLIRGVYHLSTSKVFILDNAYFPVHIIKHKKGTTVIQVWHGGGVFKKFGNDCENVGEKTEDKFRHKNYDLCIMGSDFSKKHFATATGTSLDKIIVLGCARTDLFFDDSKLERVKNEFYEKYPNLKNKKIILYAPTFRGRGSNAHCECHLDRDQMEKELKDLGYVLLYKPHLSAVAEYNEEDSFLINLDKDDILNKLMPVCDIFITDYSSSIIEYAILKKPLILYAYDVKEYEKNPGFYQDYEKETIGEKAYTTKEVIKLIKENNFNFDNYDEFINVHYKFLDGKSSQRAADYIINNLMEK